MTRAPEATARPVLKWAGGKTQLLPQIRRFYPPSFDGYFEPFVGSGAVFLDLYNRGRLAGRRVRLTDGNRDLIGCYQAIRDSVDEVIGHLELLAEGHHTLGPAHYYEVRDAQFNPARARLRQEATSPEGRPGYSPRLAAMLIYLNKTGYNGLFRLNSQGGFNVPAGRYVNPRICDPENLRRVSEALATPEVTLACRPFKDACRAARPEDFIYLDPPYAPLSRTARFTAYTAGGFSPDDQRRLQTTVIRLVTKGCWVLMSNSTAPDISELYESDTALGAGLTAHRILARRAINSRSTGRRPVEEYLITNLDQRPATPSRSS